MKDDDEWPIENADDWLATDEVPASSELVPLSTAAVASAVDAQAEQIKFAMAWNALTDGQRVFLNTWRECRFNTNKAIRVLKNTTNHTSKTTVLRWKADERFDYVRSLTRSASVAEILSKEYLALRHEDIVETLMTPKPILFQGQATGYTEVEAGAAGKANEVLLRLGGHMKDKDTEINVGLQGPSFTIQVVQRDGQVIDATPRYVDVNLPAPDGT